MSFSEIAFVEDRGDKEIHGKIYINYNKIPFFKILEEDKDGVKLAVVNRIKTTEHQYEFYLKITENLRSQFFAKYNFFRLENYYINTSMITFVKEERLNPSKVKLTFFFEGYAVYLETFTNWGRWESWRNVRLK
jgi:uncharacterized protein YifN (PemK superfamily)